MVSKNKILKDKRSEMKTRDTEAGSYATLTSSYVLELEEEAAKNYLKVSKHDVVLDAGCGVGLSSKHLVKKAKAVIGMDFSLQSLRQCRKACKNTQNLFLIQADVTQLPIKKQYFDTIVFKGVLEHIPSPDERVAALKQLKKVLKPKGQLFLTTYNYNLKNRLLQNKQGYHIKKIYYYNYSHRELKKLLYKVFKKIRVFTGIVNLYPYFLHFFGKASKYLDTKLEKSRSSLALGNFLLAVIEK